MTSDRCECPKVAFDHSAGCCPRTAVHRVLRDGVHYAVCEDCVLSGDVYVDDPERFEVSDILDWKYEAANDDTVLGLGEWIAHRDEAQ